MGFKISQTYTKDLRNSNLQSEIVVEVPAMVYMDDTIWLADSKEKMETILELVHSFTEMTGIRINTNKMDLLIINPPSKNQQSLVYGNQTIVTPRNPKPIRYLGIWLEENGKKKYQLSLIKNKLNFIIHNLQNSIITETNELRDKCSPNFANNIFNN